MKFIELFLDYLDGQFDRKQDMKKLILRSTQITPKVTFDPENSTFEMSGKSCPESVYKFYDPLMEWWSNYLDELTASNSDQSIVFKFFFDYFNSTSSKSLFLLVKKLNDFKDKGIPVTILWCYLEDDFDMLESGVEMESMTTIPFKFIAIKPG